MSLHLGTVLAHLFAPELQTDKKSGHADHGQFKSAAPEYVQFINPVEAAR